MRVITGRNVNQIFARGVELLTMEGVRETSRAGDVLVLSSPVMTVYERPCERVLLDPHRDANPFFHFFEALWMLRGSDDAAFLNKFVSDFGERFAEENGSIHDAYGWRWRHMLGFDQIEVVVAKLRKNPHDRQAVIQMWDARPADSGMDDLCGDHKTRPCNTHVYLRVRDSTHEHESVRMLDLTVLCRSNDIVWGAYGANAVHFSMLQEYIAGKLGVGVGRMYQFSNNWHGYVAIIEKYQAALARSIGSLNLGMWNTAYENNMARSSPVMSDPKGWDLDLCHFLTKPEATRTYTNPWFDHTARAMWEAHALWKDGRRMSALIVAGGVGASDWRRATTEWMQRRMK